MEKPNVAQNYPEMVELEAGKKYFWCACGYSGNKTFCDGSHKSTSFTPTMFTSDEAKKAAICCCKQTSNPPYCDGSHAKL